MDSKPSDETSEHADIRPKWWTWLLSPPPPGSQITRPLLIAGFFVLVWGEAMLGTFSSPEGGRIAETAVVSVLYAPVLAHALSVRAGALAWAVSFTALMFTEGTALTLSVQATVAILTVWIVTSRLPHRESAGFLGITFLVLALLTFLSPDEFAAPVFVVLPLLTLSAVTGFVVAFYRVRAQRAADVADQLRKRQERVRRDERTNLAHELHDNVAHDITVIAMQAQRMHIVNDTGIRNEILNGIADSARSTLEDLRKVVMVLKASEPPDDSGDMEIQASGSKTLQHGPRGGTDSGRPATVTGFEEELSRVVQELRTAGFPVVLKVLGDPSLLPESIRQTLKRVVRELGTNILKHASKETDVLVSLEVGEHEAVLQTRNATTGTLPIMSTGTGQEILAIRAEALGGTFTMGEESTGRWTTRLTFPRVS